MLFPQEALRAARVRLASFDYYAPLDDFSRKTSPRERVSAAAAMRPPDPECLRPRRNQPSEIDLEPARRKSGSQANWAASPLLLPFGPARRLHTSVRRNNSIVTAPGLTPSRWIFPMQRSMVARLASVPRRWAPHDVGQGEVLRCGRAPSAGLAWGRFPNSPRNRPRVLFVSVGFTNRASRSTSWRRRYAQCEPGARWVAAHLRRSRPTRRFPEIED